MARSWLRSSLRSDLTILAIVGVLLVAALAAGANVLYRELYSPSAFVQRYLALIEEGRAVDALAVPGVSGEGALTPTAPLGTPLSDALLRQAAMGELSEIEILSEDEDDGIWVVTVSYLAGGQPGQTDFRVEREGSNGVLPRWRFAQSPMAVLELIVRGSDSFAVNGFGIDRRQIAGVESDPLAPIALLALVPGRYEVTVDTSISRSSGTPILADTVRTTIPVDVQTVPTEQFRAVVQERVSEFLEECATKQVLLPGGCPFGFEVQDRLISLPQWSIIEHPHVELDPAGAHWRIRVTDATAQIEVDVQSIFDGTVHRVTRDVPFQVTGPVIVLADGTVSIRVGTP